MTTSTERNTKPKCMVDGNEVSWEDFMSGKAHNEYIAKQTEQKNMKSKPNHTFRLEQYTTTSSGQKVMVQKKVLSALTL